MNRQNLRVIKKKKNSFGKCVNAFPLLIMERKETTEKITKKNREEEIENAG
jgi:hypothetical protein